MVETFFFYENIFTTKWLEALVSRGSFMRDDVVGFATTKGNRSKNASTRTFFRGRK